MFKDLANINKRIGSNIRKARRFKDMKVEEITNTTGITAPTIYRIESGTTSCKVEWLIQLSELLDRDINWFINNQE